MRVYKTVQRSGKQSARAMEKVICSEIYRSQMAATHVYNNLKSSYSNIRAKSRTLSDLGPNIYREILKYI